MCPSWDRQALQGFERNMTYVRSVSLVISLWSCWDAEELLNKKVLMVSNEALLPSYLGGFLLPEVSQTVPSSLDGDTQLFAP